MKIVRINGIKKSARTIKRNSAIAEAAVDNLVQYIKSTFKDEVWKDMALNELNMIKTRLSTINENAVDILDFAIPTEMEPETKEE